MNIMKVMRDDDGFLLLNENERKQREKETEQKIAYHRLELFISYTELHKECKKVLQRRAFK